MSEVFIRIKEEPKELSLIQLILDNNVHLSRKDVEEIIMYNVITPKQLARITGNGVSAIQNRMRPTITTTGFMTILDKVYPFRTPKDSGPTFIHFNKKCEHYIIKSLRLKQIKNGRTNKANPGIR